LSTRVRVSSLFLHGAVHLTDGIQGIITHITYYGRALQANLGEPGTGARPSVAPIPGVRPSMPTPQASPSTTPPINRSLLWLIGIVVVIGGCLWFLRRRRSEPEAYSGAPPSSGYSPYDYRGAPQEWRNNAKLRIISPSHRESRYYRLSQCGRAGTGTPGIF